MIPPKEQVITPPCADPSQFDLNGLKLAITEAKAGLAEGGVPIGGALVSKDAKVIGTGRNRRVQDGSSIHHGETNCLENCGRLPASVYRDCTMFTTLSPCTMCTGAIILYGIPRVVIGENETFAGGEDILISRGVEVVNLNSSECKELMAQFIKEKPEVWSEDIGDVPTNAN